MMKAAASTAANSMMRLIIAVWFMIAVTAAHAVPAWTLSVDEKIGLPVLSKGGAVAVKPGFLFWGSNWGWTDTSTTLKAIAPFEYSLIARNKALDFDLTADVRKASERVMNWSFAFDAHSMQRDVIGGGLVFGFDLAAFGAEMGEPVLLPENRGWTWGREGGNRIEMRFEPPLVSVYFERGNKNELRAFFYKSLIPQGQLRHAVTVTLSGDMSIGPTTGERFGLADPATWPADRLDAMTAPVDLSFLNEPEKPAGKRGFVKAAGDRLTFADGTPARFWGTNLTAYALFNTSREAVRAQAKRLSALGFNLVRIHHHDSPWVNPNIFVLEKAVQDTQRLSADSLDRLDWWIKCLKDEGIYIWLDLHVQRALKAGDGIWGFDEMRKGKQTADLKGYSYVNIAVQQAMKRFAEAYVTHVNSYTGSAYKDEAAIAAMLITNENDITHHFGNALLPDKKVPDHNRLYMAEAEGFARAHGLPKDKTWRSWEHGPSKIFLNDLERRFNVEMITHLRGLGVKVPIATTSTWGNGPLSSLPALTSGDVIDVHAYGGAGQLEKSPMLGASLVHWLAAGQVAGKPMTVTEWNPEPFPLPDRHSAPLYVAAAASHQGWDALMQYAYSQEPFRGSGSPSNWHAYNDPALLATLPAAALLYRRGDVREATTTYVFDPGRDMLFYQAISAATSPALRTAVEKGRLLIAMPQTKELPWLERSALPKDAKVFRDPVTPLIDAQATEATSDTGELTHNWGKGTYVINTPRTQAATGWIGGEAVVLPEVTIRTRTRYASVAVQSLDDAPISGSRNLLISLSARAVPKAGNKTPFNVEPVEGQLSVRAPKGLRLYRNGILQERREIPLTYRDGKYFIPLDEAQGSNWLVLRAGQ